LAEPATSPRKAHALELFRGLPGGYDRVGAVMSFGQDPRWRAALVRAIDPRPDQRILDVATGTGMVAFALAERGAEVVGLDQSQEMLGRAQAKLAAAPQLRGRVKFVQGEAERLPFAEAEFYVDDPRATLTELSRVVRPGGRIGMLEFGVPSAPALRALWRFHTRRVLPALGRVVSPAWFEVGRFLGPNIEAFHTQEPDLACLWREAGIEQVEARRMSFGAGLVMWGLRS
jgi:demethylmenaquinone methyltransferase/2-methoxy-6-polyprenyl-1,4-benzoquinol methylase